LVVTPTSIPRVINRRPWFLCARRRSVSYMGQIVHGPLTWMNGIIPGKPFTAEIEERLARRTFWERSKASTTYGSLARDSSGRMRLSYTVKPILWQPVAVVTILDPVSGSMFVFRNLSRTCIRSPLRETLNPSTAIAQADSEHRVIEGLDCVRLPVAPDIGLEVWMSEELNQVVLEKNASNEHVWRLVNVHRREPRPELFKPPPGITIVDG